MFEEYHQIDDQVCRIEEDVERASDQELETLKMRRVILKDGLFHGIMTARPNARVAVAA
jgi:uncharacterized protein YdcH (DUF465 family)